MKNYNDLLNQAKKLNTVDEQVSLIFKYLLGNVEYNYASLFKQLLFSDVDDLLDTYESMESSYSDMDEKERATDFIEFKVNEIAKELISDNDLLNREVYKLLYALALTEEKSDILKMLGETSATIDNPIYEEGLLKRGSCFDIVDFMVTYFKDLGIKTVRVSGDGIPAQWLIVYYGGQPYRLDSSSDKFIGIQPYHLDPSSAMFIRDKVTNIHGRQTDYMKFTNSDLFALNPDRNITIIGRNLLSEPITINNYSQPYNEYEVKNTKH